MKTVAQRLRYLALTSVVLGALAFGARQALAASGADCIYDPPTLLGACTSDQNCQEMCTPVWHPDPVEGHCISGCCVCYAL